MYYTVKNRDTLQRVASKFYGDWTLYKLIADTNGITSIVPGLRLEIPEPVTIEMEHVIISGDSYEKLSLQYYGTEHFSGLLFSENNGLVLEENIGVIILVPALVSQRRFISAGRNFL